MFNLTPFSPLNFGRYASQTEYSMDESNNINERTQIQQKSIINNIPSLMSLSITSPPITTTNIQQKSTIPTSVIKENIEPLPFPQYGHGPGPIQRPNKLPCLSATRSSPSSFIDPTQSPSTPDVLSEINHLLDHQNSITTIPSTPNILNSTNSSTIINDISTPNIPWTPFTSTEWSSKYDTSWPVTNIQSSNVSLTTQIQNPFSQRQISTEASAVWPSALETTRPRSISSSNTHTEHTSEWNGLFSSAVPSPNETTEPINNSWSTFLPVPNPSSVDGIISNRQENETNIPFWNPININETQQNSSTSWWSKPSSDENNNNDNDQSRWDFAR